MTPYSLPSRLAGEHRLDDHVDELLDVHDLARRGDAGLGIGQRLLGR